MAVKIPLLLEWLQVNIPLYCDRCILYCKDLWNLIVLYSISIYQAFLQIAHEVWIWLQENVFVGKFSIDNIQAKISSSVADIQSYGVEFVHWMSNLWSTSIGSISAANDES